MDTVNIYWSNYSKPDRASRQALYMDEWKPLLPDILKVNKGEYGPCKGLHSVFKNTFYIEHPKDLSFTIDSSLKSDTVLEDGWIYLENPAINQKITFHYDLQWLFFAEESIEIVQTPAYMHNGLDRQYGHGVAGSFDISKWLRPIGASYQLWDGESHMSFKKGDPITYINFITDKKVNLVRFEMTDKVYEVASGASNLKAIMPNLPISDLYRRFESSKRNKVIMREISSNLL